MSGHSQAILELSDQCFYTGQLIFLMASDEKKKKISFKVHTTLFKYMYSRYMLVGRVANLTMIFNVMCIM